MIKNWEPILSVIPWLSQPGPASTARWMGSVVVALVVYTYKQYSEEASEGPCFILAAVAVLASVL